MPQQTSEQATQPASTTCRSDQMRAELSAQEKRGMAKYATDEPSENWGEDFWRRFSRWNDELQAYQRQEHAELTAPSAAGGARGARP
jgi:hypothetical protein